MATKIPSSSNQKKNYAYSVIPGPWSALILEVWPHCWCWKHRHTLLAFLLHLWFLFAVCQMSVFLQLCVLEPSIFSHYTLPCKMPSTFILSTVINMTPQMSLLLPDPNSHLLIEQLQLEVPQAAANLKLNELSSPQTTSLPNLHKQQQHGSGCPKQKSKVSFRLLWLLPISFRVHFSATNLFQDTRVFRD